MATFTTDVFKNIINQYGGEQAVLTITLNNTYVRSFVEEPFSFAQYLDEENGFLVFDETDPMGAPYKVLRSIEYVESIVFATDMNNIPTLTRYIHS